MRFQVDSRRWRQRGRRDPGHGRVAWSEKLTVVRFGQNRTRHGLRFENEETRLALLREAGFEQIEVGVVPAWGQTTG